MNLKVLYSVKEAKNKSDRNWIRGYLWEGGVDWEMIWGNFLSDENVLIDKGCNSGVYALSKSMCTFMISNFHCMQIISEIF